MYFLRVALMKCRSYGKRLRVDPRRLMLPPKVEQEVLQGVKVVQMADRCIDHKHHLAWRAQTRANTQTQSVLSGSQERPADGRR